MINTLSDIENEYEVIDNYKGIIRENILKDLDN
jgi:hypothetical protein